MRTDSTSKQPAELYLGVDPGLSCTGYALLKRSVKGPVLCEAGVIRSTAKRSLAERVHEIGEGMRDLFEEFQPDVMAIEQVFSHIRHPKAALMMCHARGVILFTAADRNIPIVHFTPTQVKRLLTGSGRAPKAQIQHAVKRELGLQQILEPNDVADASAVALCLYHSVRFAA